MLPVEALPALRNHCAAGFADERPLVAGVGRGGAVAGPAHQSGNRGFYLLDAGRGRPGFAAHSGAGAARMPTSRHWRRKTPAACALAGCAGGHPARRGMWMCARATPTTRPYGKNAGLQRRRHRPHAAGLDAAHPPRRPGTHRGPGSATSTATAHCSKAPTACAMPMAATTGRTTVVAPSNATPRGTAPGGHANRHQRKLRPARAGWTTGRKRAGLIYQYQSNPDGQFFPHASQGRRKFTAAARKSCVPALSTHCGASTRRPCAWRRHCAVHAAAHTGRTITVCCCPGVVSAGSVAMPGPSAWRAAWCWHGYIHDTTEAKQQALQQQETERLLRHF